ncbi:MAG: flagellar basal body L-ring protein FlgH [Pseudomonadota bacterium]
MTNALRFIALGCLTLTLSACGHARAIKDIGRAPDMAPIENPAVLHDNKSVQMPMPAAERYQYEPNSLWRTGARAFFKDQRARRVGDILTVEINITDRAQLNNTTSRSRSNDEDSNLTSFLGFEGRLSGVLPDGVNPSSLTDFGSASSSTGAGSVNRQETVALTVAAVVTQVLPNGNFVIAGRQEVRVNFEVRELIITGVVRPEDIANSNTIQHTQIAEARISYGGRGQITAVQQPRYGQQFYDIIFPF